MISKQMKLLSAAFLSVLSIELYSSQAQAAESPEALVEEYVQAMNEHDWNTFAELHRSEEKNSLYNFFADPANEAEHSGVLNVQNAVLNELVEINLEDAAGMLYHEYDVENSKVFVFGVDYSVYDESKYYSSGINYNFITCINENGEWKVAEMLPIADPEKLLYCGYLFSNDYDAAIYVMSARQRGYLVNYNGETFGVLNESASEMSTNGILPRAILNQRTVPTNSTTIIYKNSSGGKETLNFHSYCLGVLAGEVRGISFDGIVRQAQAIAIKTFTWHYKIVPHGATEGYDVNYAQQSYQPSKVSENSNVTTDYNAVKSVWMESYGGAIFTAYYKAGTYADQASYKNGGEFKQNGARWLYDNNQATTYKALLKYYYDSSTASTGGAIRFFDDNKNEI